jgi:S-adenosylmethionine synthetase
MSKHIYSFTSESVSEGHPDKVADQISDTVLDAYLSQDPDAKVACECLITNQQLILAGEITSTVKLNEIAVARHCLQKIGYDDIKLGFDYQSANYQNLIHKQSKEIYHSVKDGGAGDQGLMFGYACNETEELMPLPITLAHKLMQRQAELRKNGVLNFLGPDAKSQVSVLYGAEKPLVQKLVLSTQHHESISQHDLHTLVKEHIILPVIHAYIGDTAPEYIINPSGSFTIGGPISDTGLTGRKIIVDTYGGSCAHGGGAFSGKDPSKVDRSAAYAARWVAKHIVAAGLSDACTIQVAYAIGLTAPVSVYVDLHHSSRAEVEQVKKAVLELFDLSPLGIIKQLNLKRPIYSTTAAYGHFGRADFPWEKINPQIVETLQSLLNVSNDKYQSIN